MRGLNTFLWRSSALLLLSLLMPRPAWTWEVSLPLEAARLTPPARLAQAQGLAAGSCIELSGVEEPEAFVRGTPAPRGKAIFQVSPPVSRFTVWVRVQWHCYCSRSLAFSTTGILEDTTAASTGCTLRSAARPGAWHWLRVGSVRCGTQEEVQLSFAQEGHQARLAEILLSDQPDTPPRVAGEREAFVLDAVPPAAFVQRDNVECAEIAGARLWGDFTLRYTLRWPPLQEPQVARLRLGDVQGDALTVEITRFPQAPSRVALVASGPEGERHLATTEFEDLGNPTAVEFCRIGERCRVAINGSSWLEALCGKPEEGRFRFERNLPALQVLEVEVQPEQCYALHAGELAAVIETPGWTGGGLSVRDLPAPLSEAPALEAKLRVVGDGETGIVLGGAAGQSAVLIGPTGYLRLVRMMEDRLEELWRQAVPLAPDQWFNLRLEQVSEGLAIYLDDLPLEFLQGETAPSSAGRHFALASGAGQTLQCALVRASTWVESHANRMGFEPFEDERSLAHWRVLAGEAMLRGHPAELLLRGSARLAYRRAFSHGCSAGLLLTPPQDATHALGLPGSTRVGITFASPEVSGREIFAYTDAETHTLLGIAADGQILAETIAPRSVQGSAGPLSFSVEHGRAQARLGDKQLQAAAPWLDGGAVVPGLCSEAGDAGEVRVSSITVGPAFSPLPQGGAP